MNLGIVDRELGVVLKKVFNNPQYPIHNLLIIITKSYINFRQTTYARSKQDYF